MARLRIPERHKEPLRKLMALPDGDIAQLRNALNEVEPAQTYRALAARLASRVDMPSETTLDLVALLTSLALTAYRGRVKLEDVSADATAAAAEAGLLPSDKPPEEQRAALRHRLTDLLTANAVNITAKAGWLLSQYERQFVECAIYSDIRTVFLSNEEGGGPQTHSAVVVHNLEVEFHRGPEHESEFFALDGADLRTLRAAIERAILKEEQLRAVIEKAGLRYLAVE